jgi:hypothetical protein
VCSESKVVFMNSSLFLFLRVRGVSVVCGLELVLGCDRCLDKSVSDCTSCLTGFLCLLLCLGSVWYGSVAAGSVQLPGGGGGSVGSGVVGLVDEELYSSVVNKCCLCVVCVSVRIS